MSLRRLCAPNLRGQEMSEEEPFFNKIRRERPEAFLREVVELLKEELSLRDAEMEELREDNLRLRKLLNRCIEFIEEFVVCHKIWSATEVPSDE